MLAASDRSLTAALKDRILAAGRQILASTDRSPANDGFHAARYALYEIAAGDHSAEVVSMLASDAEIQDISSRIFPISCDAGVHEECAIAAELLADPDLTFGKIYRRYYGEIYETLMSDELGWLEGQAGIDMARQRVAYIGGGAMPLPALLMAQRTGCRVTIVDPHEPSCAFARRMIERIGLSHLVDVVTRGGQDFDYNGCTLVWIANWITDKRPIFSQLKRYAGLAYVIARSAAGNSLSFIINDAVDQDQVCDGTLSLAYQTPRRACLSLNALIFRNKPCDAHALHTAPATEQTTMPVRRIVGSMTELIGNTPMLRLDPAKTGLKNIDLYAKLEHMNPFGSIKDRTALGMIGPHIAEIAKRGMKVMELSSGNAARGLQAIASMHGTALETVSNRIRLAEMRKVLQIQGAQITPLGEVDPHDAYAALKTVDQRAAANRDSSFYTDQYRNPANDGTHYGQTGREIAEDLGSVDYFIGAVGTAGSTVGISRRLREASPDLDVTGVISEKDDFIPGIRHKDEIFNIGPYREDHYNRVVDVSAQEAIDGVLDLVRLYGVMAGPSSGATYHAALRHLRTEDAKVTSRKTAVFVVFDRLELYLSYIEDRRPDLFA